MSGGDCATPFVDQGRVQRPSMFAMTSPMIPSGISRLHQWVIDSFSSLIQRKGRRFDDNGEVEFTRPYNKFHLDATGPSLAVLIDPLYDASTNHWKGFPVTSPSLPSNLSATAHLLKSLIEQLSQCSDVQPNQRQLFDCSVLRGDDHEVPSLCVTNLDEFSFHGESDMEYPGYHNILLSIGITTDTDMSNVEQQVAEASRYAARTLIGQANRSCARVLMMSETMCRVFHFTRTPGVRYSIAFNFHSDPVVFTRLFLGLISNRPQNIGFYEDTIRPCPADSPEAVIKIVPDEDEEPYLFTVSRDIPIVDSFGYWTVWNVFSCDADDNENAPFLLKVAYAPDQWDLTEIEVLRVAEAKDLPGVARMVAYQEESDRYDFETKTHTWCKLTPAERRYVQHCIVLEAHGLSIDHFETSEQAFEAFIDCMTGHGSFANLGVLHRNITVKNIILGKPNAKKGWRGVLFNFDSAAFVDPSTFEPKPAFPPIDDLLETPFSQAFQSVETLRSHSTRADNKGKSKGRKSVKTRSDRSEAMNHDYLDELQSFFYVLLWLCTTYRACSKSTTTTPIAKTDPFPKELAACFEVNGSPESIEKAIEAKLALMMDDLLWSDLTKQASDAQEGSLICPILWGKPTVWLLTKFRSHLQHGLKAKEEVRGGRMTMAEFKERFYGGKNMLEQYTEIVWMLEDAVNGIDNDTEDFEGYASVRDESEVEDSDEIGSEVKAEKAVEGEDDSDREAEEEVEQLLLAARDPSVEAQGQQNTGNTTQATEQDDAGAPPEAQQTEVIAEPAAVKVKVSKAGRGKNVASRSAHPTDGAPIPPVRRSTRNTKRRREESTVAATSSSTPTTDSDANDKPVTSEKVIETDVKPALRRSSRIKKGQTVEPTAAPAPIPSTDDVVEVVSAVVLTIKVPARGGQKRRRDEEDQNDGMIEGKDKKGRAVKGRKAKRARKDKEETGEKENTSTNVKAQGATLCLHISLDRNMPQ
ncbi:other/FunK1 protein kinase [Coprinopsis cinerea okayama7|uniref:Other/FunK1 protein kinase n=1 Tax=Coprinopsis cinerea (strain Okayama-7 / 130 / ATCC MYA-4618 / FGSC 9003) TaxID=240176 RepID=A8P9C9_COPC7|nr:other/FunK1 protein kinase [Coprinopsis cinerea okayama7\|eukprot:XP_001839743.1 other/FunK1 protein kinase [Coprinopsis cinerea okayama7\